MSTIKTPIELQNEVQDKQNQLIAGEGIELVNGASEKFETNNLQTWYDKIWVNTYLANSEIVDLVTDITATAAGEEVILMYTESASYGDSSADTAIVAQASVINDNPYWKLLYKSETASNSTKEICHIQKEGDTYTGGWKNISDTGAFLLGETVDLVVAPNKVSVWNGKLIGKKAFDNKTQISAKIPSNVVSSNSVKTIWSGTQAQYDAITTKDVNTLYLIK